MDGQRLDHARGRDLLDLGQERGIRARLGVESPARLGGLRDLRDEAVRIERSGAYSVWGQAGGYAD